MTTEKEPCCPPVPIPGGYVIKARKIQESEIARKPPHVRETFDWLVINANHKDVRLDGTVIRRGQLLTTYDDILDSLSWTVGWRKMRYSKSNCESAMKILKKAGMITTQKTTRGMFITIVNYDFYQTAANYESHSENRETATREPQTRHTINKNEKKEKKEDTDTHGEERLAPPDPPSKEKPKQKQPDPNVTKVVKHFQEVYKEELGMTPAYSKADFATVKGALDQFPLEKLQQVIEFIIYMFKENDKFTLTLKLCASAWAINTYHQKWADVKWEHGNGDEPPTDIKWWR